METNYIEINEGNIEKAELALCSDATYALKDQLVTSALYGKGKIKTVSKVINANNIVDIMLEIEFKDEIKKICYFTAARNRVLTIDDETAKTVIDSFKDELEYFKQAFEEEQHRKFEESKRAFDERTKAKKLDEHNKRMEAKRKCQKESAIRCAARLTSINPSKVDEFYTCLGWITKHVKNIEARMPDFLEQWFISQFGDAERKVIDSSKITSGGNIPQWTLSIKIIVDTNDNMPAALVEMLGEESKKTRPISRTDFVFTLCKDYGFKFGKEQNIDDILEHIPADKLDSFNFGLDM